MVAACFVFFLTSLKSFAAGGLPTEPFREDAPLEITADNLTFDREMQSYNASGNVVIVQGSAVLKSDFAILDTVAGTASARGNVVVVDEGGNTLTSDSLQMDLRQKTAVIAKGRLFFKTENIHIAADNMYKTGPQTYYLDLATYTSCDCAEGETPAWNFSIKEVNIPVGEYLTGRNAFFYIKGVPVFYSPYVSIPVRRERQTGFLMPKPRYSRLRGFGLDNEFFWAMAKNADMTLYLDIETVRGLGKGLEYRYIRTGRSFGEAYLYSFREEDIGRVRAFRSGAQNLSRPLSATDNRWRLKLNHTELMNNGFVFKANADVLSDKEYLLDFGKGADRGVESIESNLSISKATADYSLVGQMRFFNNLLVEGDTKTFNRAPELTFTMPNKGIYTSPFYFSMDSSLVNFSRKEGVKGQRLDWLGRVSLPLNPDGYLDFTPSIGARATFYQAHGRPEGRYADRYLYDFKAESAATFVRVYPSSGSGADMLRHTIRPKLSYTYIPEAVQTDLPAFDAIDNIAAASAFTYSLNNTLTARHEQEGRQIYTDRLYLDISQTYDYNEATRKLTAPTDKRRPFSDVTLELRLQPTERTGITGKGLYNVYERWFTSYDTSLSVSDERGDGLTVTHRFVRDLTRYIEGSVRLKLGQAVAATYLQRYSLDKGLSLETAYGLEYNQQCWGAVLSYSQKPEEKLIYVTFSLTGIGRIAGLQQRLENM